MNIKVLVVGPMRENCYIISNKSSNNCIIIDPGEEANKIVEYINSEKLNPVGIVLTHGHFDHIGAVEELKEIFKIKCYSSKEESALINDENKNLSMAYLKKVIKFKPDILFEDGDEVAIEDIKFLVILTPGHTSGGACLYFTDEKFIMTGDTLFKNTIGRTDLPTSSYKDLIYSVNDKLMRLDDDIVVYPGHGSKTTIGFERRENRYIK